MTSISGRRSGGDVHRQLTIHLTHREGRTSLCNCRRIDEEEARELLARLQQTGTVWEAVVAVVHVLNLSVSAAAEAIETYLALMGIVVVAVPPDTVRSRSTHTTGSARAGTGDGDGPAAATTGRGANFLFRKRKGGRLGMRSLVDLAFGGRDFRDLGRQIEF